MVTYCIDHVRKELTTYLSRHQLKMVTAIYTRHAPVRGHPYTMVLFDGDPTCRFCGMETETVQHIICCCEVLDGQRYNVFGRATVEPKDISTASVRELCLFIRGAGLLRLCWTKYQDCTISLGLWRIRWIRWWALRRRRTYCIHYIIILLLCTVWYIVYYKITYICWHASSSFWGATTSETFWPSRRVSSVWSGLWCSPSGFLCSSLLCRSLHHPPMLTCWCQSMTPSSSLLCYMYVSFVIQNLKKKRSSQRRCYGHQMTLNSFSKHDTTTCKTEWQTTFRSFLSCNTCPSDIWSKSHVYLSYINKKDWVRGQFCGYQMQCFQNILEDLHVCTVCQWRLKHF